MYENYLIEALEMVLAWDLPDEELQDAVNTQARLMAGINPEDLQGHPPDTGYSLINH